MNVFPVVKMKAVRPGGPSYDIEGEKKESKKLRKSHEDYENNRKGGSTFDLSRS
jgi:hypothetical protein